MRNINKNFLFKKEDFSMEVATYTYFCDCCGKQVENKTDLKRIEIVLFFVILIILC